LRVTGFAKYNHCCAENVAASAIAFSVGRANALHPRAPCALRRKFLDGKPSMAMPFNAESDDDPMAA
jgi:hypothetical protein